MAAKDRAAAALPGRAPGKARPFPARRRPPGGQSGAARAEGRGSSLPIAARAARTRLCQRHQPAGPPSTTAAAMLRPRAERPPAGRHPPRHRPARRHRPRAASGSCGSQPQALLGGTQPMAAQSLLPAAGRPCPPPRDGWGRPWSPRPEWGGAGQGPGRSWGSLLGQRGWRRVAASRCLRLPRGRCFLPVLLPCACPLRPPLPASPPGGTLG